MVDTLIVGGGTAGCVLAARLSEDPNHTVLLLEAGPVWEGPAQLPAALRDATAMPIGPESPWLWRYPVMLAPDVSGGLVRGRVLGGSGSINGGYFTRATPSDFDRWSRSLGGSSTWSYESVLPAYQKLERDLDYGDCPWHGNSGPMPVRRIAEPAHLSLEFAAAAMAAGFPELPDLNALVERSAPGASIAEAGMMVGVGPVPCNVVDGVRVSTAAAYLLPVLGRSNLTVTGGMTVARILFRGARAVGVDCVGAGGTRTIAADRVVVCAGAIESAALLMRSGIGEADQLRGLGIPVVQEAPVGVGFYDHPEIGIEYRLPVRASGAGGSTTVPLEYVLGLDDVEIRPYAVSFVASQPQVRRLGVALMRPHGTGVLRLASVDPDVPPNIEHRYLVEGQDRQRLREAVQVAAEVLARMSVTTSLPTGAVADSWLRANLGTSQHLSGTCPMGGADAVVDERCRVHGVTGLSVVDLSVVPVPLSRGPQATTVLIAERGADFLTVE